MIVVALDVGDRRIGVAVSDPGGTLATPHSVIVRRSKAEDFAALAQLVTAVGAGRVVVGLPLTLDGQMGPQARRVARYARALGAALGMPIELVDERYSTVEAAERLAQSNPAHAGAAQSARRSGRRRRTAIDAAAAAVILQDYLDHPPGATGQAEGDTRDENSGAYLTP
jgi:putative Holliday junction resolvase